MVSFMPLQDNEIIGTPTLFTRCWKGAGYRVTQNSVTSIVIGLNNLYLLRHGEKPHGARSDSKQSHILTLTNASDFSFAASRGAL